jgi:tRNA modification GTPase
MQALLGKALKPREATFTPFRDNDGNTLDAGVALYFQSPHSYTGEDVLELQAHGGQALLAMILDACITAGAQLAKPGEFTERAFLNGKMDLAQAEAVADLIDASSASAARSAARSLVGEFSKRVEALKDLLVELRMHIEACIDFPEEEIDPADTRWQIERALVVKRDCALLLEQGKQGAVLREGISIVLIGSPNVGKSSLLNRLAADEVAIVTPIAGTTRDWVKITVHLSGVPIHLIDTAGIRETTDLVEQIGIQRTWQAVELAAAVLVLTAPDEAGDQRGRSALLAQVREKNPTAQLITLHNKSDLVPSHDRSTDADLWISAASGEGMEQLQARLLKIADYQPNADGVFMARERHLRLLRSVLDHVGLARVSLDRLTLELAAEELRLAQDALSGITGEFTPDDLLGEIFGKFCIGK